MRCPAVRKPPLRRLAWHCCAPAAAWFALGCGAHFDGVEYHRGALSFRVGTVPSTWRRIDVSDALLAYRDDTVDATVALNGRCGDQAEDVPLEALTRHLFLYFTDRRMLRQERVTMDGREAMRTELVAKLDGVPKGFVVYVMKKNGCVYDFLYISRPDTLEAGRAGFERFVAGFGTR